MYPCILFALNREAQPFYRRFRTRRRLAGAPCPAWLCGDSLGRVVVLESGVGAERCEAALHWLTDSHLPDEGFLQPLLLCAAGFAGALQEDWHVGDILLASEVVGEDGGSWPRDPWIDAQAGGSWREGRLLTATGIVGEPQEKQRLGERFGTAAVDMESAAAARFCLSRGIPFAAVRAISDGLHTRLSPRLVDLLSGPTARPARVLTALTRSPSLLPELWRLARDTRRAARCLADALAYLLGARDGLSGHREEDKKEGGPVVPPREGGRDSSPVFRGDRGQSL